MTASDIATSLIPALRGQGFNAVRHPEPTPNGYGHKITLFEQAGPALGTLVIYAGKNGPRYTTNELRNLTPRSKHVSLKPGRTVDYFSQMPRRLTIPAQFLRPYLHPIRSSSGSMAPACNTQTVSNSAGPA